MLKSSRCRLHKLNEPADRRHTLLRNVPTCSILNSFQHSRKSDFFYNHYKNSQVLF